jgi:hypothetical protein
VYTHNPFTAYHRSGPYVVLIPVDRKDGEVLNNTLALKGSGPFLWDLLKEEKSKDDLVEALLIEYEVDAETAEKDVENFLETLLEWKALLRS